MSKLITFSVGLFQPLPDGGALYTTDINPDVDGLSWSTTLPGGFAGMAISLAPRAWSPPRPQLVKRHDIRRFMHAKIIAGAATVYEGRDIGSQWHGGRLTQINAEGYGGTATKDNWYAASAAGPGTGTAAGLLRDVIRVAAPILKVDENNWADSAVVHSASEADRLRPADVIQRLSAEGGGVIPAPWDFSVWEDQKAWWLPRVTPPQADYEISEDDSVDRKEDYSDLYHSVAVDYTPTAFGASSTTPNLPITDPLIEDFFIRSTILKAGTMTAAQAAAFQATQRSLLSQPKVSITVTRTDEEPLQMPGGAGKPAWLVRAGEWITVGSIGPLPIIQTDYTAAKGGTPGQVVIQVGWYPRDYLNVVYGLQRAAQSTAYRLMPVSGAPW